MYKHKDRTIDIYLQTAAGMKLLRELLFMVSQDAYIVLPAPKCDAFHKRIEKVIDKYRSLSEELMFKDHKSLDGTYIHAFYGPLSSKNDETEKLVAEKALKILERLTEKVKGGKENDPGRTETHETPSR